MPSSNNTKPSHGDVLLGDVEIRDLSNTKERPAYVPKGGSVTRVGGQNIVTVEMPKEQAVQTFEPGRIHDQKGVKYSDVVKGIPPSVAAATQGARFRISDLSRGPLSIEAEEEERIESEVQTRLAKRVEELREQTTAEAFKKGFEAGKKEGHEEILAESRPRLEALERLLAAFDGVSAEILKANEEFVIHMVYQLAKSVVLRELKEDPDYTRRLATQLLERIGTRENIKIFVSAAEVSSAEALKEGLAQKLGQLKNISVELDPEESQGGCRVETEFGEVDARIEVQIQNIANGLGVTVAKP